MTESQLQLRLRLEGGELQRGLRRFPEVVGVEKCQVVAAGRAQWRAATKTTRTADEYAFWLKEMLGLENLRFGDLDACIIASVIPAALFDLRSLCRRYLNFEPLVVGEADVDLGIGIKVDRPGAVGADRLVNTVAAHAAYPGALIVVDFGTATTFNAINAAGEFLGGAISPGLLTCSEALFARAAKLPHVQFERPGKVIGSSTVAAIQSGLYHGYTSLVDGLLERMIAEMGVGPRVIATGGLAPAIAPGSRYIERVDETLTLDGLRLVYERLNS